MNMLGVPKYTVNRNGLQILIKKLRNREKIVTQRLDKRNTPKSHRLTHLHHAH
jgi:hypothetical protein